jgi:hypothetical protein
MSPGSALILIALVLLGVVAIVVVKVLRIYSTALRMGLRDRGKTAAIYDGDTRSIWIHPLCSSRLRIGIMRNGIAVRYCSKCETVVDEDEDPDPRGREGLPTEAPNGKVIALPNRPAA